MRTVLPTIVHSCTQAWGRRGSLVRSCARKVYTDCSLGAMGSRLGSTYVRTYVRIFYLFVVLLPWVVGRAGFSFSLWSWCHGSPVGQCFLSLCGLGAMGRRLDNGFFLFVVLAPWVVGWAMFSLSWAIGRRLGSLDCRLDCRLLVDFWFCYVRTYEF